MKRLLSLIIILAFVSLAVSCHSDRDAYDMVNEFVTVYGAEGVIYSPRISEGENGYVPKGLMEMIYVFSGDFPGNYAVFLNSHHTTPAECGAFVCENADSLAATEEMCLERIKLLSRGESHAFVKVSGMIVFYSTMKNRERAERIWHEIIR